jgi:hypothetical protein
MKLSLNDPASAFELSGLDQNIVRWIVATTTFCKPSTGLTENMAGLVPHWPGVIALKPHPLMTRLQMEPRFISSGKIVSA